MIKWDKKPNGAEFARDQSASSKIVYVFYFNRLSLNFKDGCSVMPEFCERIDSNKCKHIFGIVREIGHYTF